MRPFEVVVCDELLAEAQRILAAGAAPAAAVSRAALPPAMLSASGATRKAVASLAPVYKEAAAIGMQLLPLRSPADILKLAEAELLYPAGVPFRTRKMLAELARGGPPRAHQHRV